MRERRRADRACGHELVSGKVLDASPIGKEPTTSREEALAWEQTKAPQPNAEETWARAAPVASRGHWEEKDGARSVLVVDRPFEE